MQLNINRYPSTPAMPHRKPDARCCLFREMGVPEETGISLVGDMAPSNRVPLLNIDEAVERRPDVKLALQSLQHAQAALASRKPSHCPTQ